MSSVEEMQNSLSRLIYSITDLNNLSRIKSVVERFASSSQAEVEAPQELPWASAVLKVKKTPTFAQEFEAQGRKSLSFAELEPLIDDADDGYSLEDLLAALN
ncbi:hypothetical protein QWY85_09380 [Neolewinella lacunae]|uniref:Uncharacterized protein n=1 Tax=Neolewinella lacunae TaxID=1517758 RepID=A0A923TF31_9BACT|nr:hypothetical protein [Neolewinella lacunae]MBC6996567.1 hypothetical protein [Neolewinella lacunae]MDN3634869.1 hypothetical protein [Neolewinella lacunae]